VNATTIEINLELELDGETVSGRAHCANGEIREFSGWIGLMGLVDSLLEGARNGVGARADKPPEEGANADHD
jgi:hypothetical protein